MGGVDTVLILPSSLACGGKRRVVVPSGDTTRPSTDTDAADAADADADASSDSVAVVLRVILLSRRECCCVSSSSLLICVGARLNI